VKERFKALLVEDDETWQGILKDALEVEGCQVQIAKSYYEARTALESETAFHLILIDRYLAGFTPVAEGEMLLQYIVRHCGEIPCIVVTGRGTIQSAVEAFKCFNVFDYIEKSSFSVQAFGDTVRKALSKANTSEGWRALQRELVAHKRNLSKLREQEAVYGVGETPLHLLNKIEAEERAIHTIREKLDKLSG
jgi:DNA-binding NtrC family response regulator